VLLVTDAYADGWTVAPVHGAQREYRVVPADYALMGIPLSAGEHLIRLEYKPTAWSAGVAVSSCAVVVYAMLWLFVARKERRKNF
jgi:uncharacterized membrane protein YfhO